jgi:hypothetical protein
MGDTAQGGLAEVHQCGTPRVVEHQQVSEGEKGRVAYTEMTRLESTTRPLHGGTSLPPPVSLFFLRRERWSQLDGLTRERNTEGDVKSKCHST